LMDMSKKMSAKPIAGSHRSQWMRSSLIIFAGMVLSVEGYVSTHKSASCPGELDLTGHGSVELVPAGWNSGTEVVEISVTGLQQIRPHLGSRAYFAHECSVGVYKREDYLGLNLLGKTLRYTTDLSTTTCGCNAAVYLLSMKQNTNRSECGDFYCDANNVCGASCAEIDLQEGNAYAWHTSLHTATDGSGLAGGYGGGQSSWNGPRAWTSAEYGPGAECIDTKRPFEVSLSFPVDEHGVLQALQLTLSQVGSTCPLRLGLGNYTGNSSHDNQSGQAMAELTAALAAGMTPVVSYWASDDLIWLDGEGNDTKGPCHKDRPKQCGDAVEFSYFSVSNIGSEATEFVWHDATTTTTTTMTTSTSTSTTKLPVNAKCSNEAECNNSAWMFLKKNLQLGGPLRFAQSRLALWSSLALFVGPVSAALLAVKRMWSLSRSRSADLTASTGARTVAVRATDQLAATTTSPSEGLLRGTLSAQSIHYQHLHHCV